jgi:hypothetical protein
MNLDSDLLDARQRLEDTLRFLFELAGSLGVGRRQIQDHSKGVLNNPDMLHQAERDHITTVTRVLYRF